MKTISNFYLSQTLGIRHSNVLKCLYQLSKLICRLVSMRMCLVSVLYVTKPTVILVKYIHTIKYYQYSSIILFISLLGVYTCVKLRDFNTTFMRSRIVHDKALFLIFRAQVVAWETDDSMERYRRKSKPCCFFVVDNGGSAKF
jgi:hypothetical protein